jgi:hypothetical protein
MTGWKIVFLFLISTSLYEMGGNMFPQFHMISGLLFLSSHFKTKSSDILHRHNRFLFHSKPVVKLLKIQQLLSSL